MKTANELTDMELKMWCVAASPGGDVKKARELYAWFKDSDQPVQLHPVPDIRLTLAQEQADTTALG